MKNYATQGCLADTLGTAYNALSQGHEFKALVWHGISLRKKEKSFLTHRQTLEYLRQFYSQYQQIRKDQNVNQVVNGY